MTLAEKSGELFRENRWFFTLFGAFLLIGAVLLLSIQTGDEIFFFSARRSTVGDLFFRWFTQMGEAWPYFFMLLLLLFTRYRYAFALPLLALSLSLISYGSKIFFGHDRPLAFLTKEGLFELVKTVEGVVLNGGTTSFPSGHTMSAFALYGFVALCLPQKRWMAVLLFCIALLVAISRIYLVQHFLKDIYAGAIFGIVIAIIWYWIQQSWNAERRPWLDSALLKRAEEQPVA